MSTSHSGKSSLVYSHLLYSRYPNVAQELISNSFLLVQAIIDGGWIMKTVITELTDDEKDVDEEAKEADQEPDEEA
jgi:hypothetical protein